MSSSGLLSDDDILINACIIYGPRVATTNRTTLFRKALLDGSMKSYLFIDCI